MKKLITACLLLATTCAVAQQGGRPPRDPRLDSLLTEKDPAALKQRITKLEKGNEDDLGVLLQYYNQKDEGTADSLFEAIIKQYPLGKFAAVDRQNKIYQGKTGKEQEAMAASFQKDFPGKDYDMIYYSVANAYVVEKNTKKSLEYLKKIKQQSSRLMSVQIIAGQLMAYDAKSAEALVKQELDNARSLAKNPDPGRAGDRLANPRADYYRFLNLYAQILQQQKNYTDALKYTKEVYDSTKNKSQELKRDYGFLLSKDGQYKEAFPLMDSIVRDGKGDAELKRELGIAYEKLNPGKKGTEYLAQLQANLAERMKKEVAKMLISEAAPAFSVKDVKGNTVSLADFKGKVIVLDFWATWCGPCKKSFPAMQRAVDKYSKDPNVKFLFIHTWERSETPQRDAQEYLSQNKYRFDLYMDTKDAVTRKNNAVSAFGVKGIPAKFVIDAEGNIRFKMTGFSGGDDVAVEELSAMIELAAKKAS